MSLKLQILPVTAFQQNCSLVWQEGSGEAVVIDPGGEAARILAAAEKAGVRIAAILVTHGHLDHAGAVADLKERLGVPVIGPQQEDAFWIDAMRQQAVMFGFPPTARPFTPDRWLEHGEVVDAAGLQFEVLHLPGHTPGHVAFFNRAGGVVFVGDVLFAGAIGRTDFPRGDHDTLIGAIRKRLFPLGDDITFVPGHGPTGTLGEERRTNPFVGEG